MGIVRSQGAPVLSQTRGDAGPHGHGVGALARSEARGLLSPPAL